MKVSASTSIEDSALARVRAVAAKTHSTEAAVLRWCIMKGITGVEHEVMGAAAPAQPPPAEAGPEDKEAAA